MAKSASFEVENVTTKPGEDPAYVLKRAAAELGVPPEAIAHCEVWRRSIDARKRSAPLLRHTVFVTLQPNAKPRPSRACKASQGRASAPLVPKAKRQARVVILGAGPAGLFAAYRLAEAGLRPIIVDRGKAVEPRAQDVQKLKRQRILDQESNYCFGEGGAGTWSDGKLTTRIGDERVDAVFRAIVDNGGPADILVDGKPHLGTNRLVKLLRTMRAGMISRGVEYRFSTRVDDLVVQGGKVTGVKVRAADQAIDSPTADTIECDYFICAAGHSARDAHHMLLRAGAVLEPKSFAVGFRVEHSQEWLDLHQYGPGEHQKYLPAADYRLTDNLELHGDKRGVYSFCMCPGGVIVITATEPGGLCINGMSHASRNSPWANSAVVVSVDPKDFAWGGGSGVLAGVEFQRRAERAAFERGGSTFAAPAQRVSDFVAGKTSQDLRLSSYRPGVVPTSLDDIYPSYVNEALRIAIKGWNRRMPGYLTSEAHLLGVETRTSSPVRVTRGENLESISLARLIPVGEGAGYAGGIMSAAVDGLRAADKIISELQ